MQPVVRPPISLISLVPALLILSQEDEKRASGSFPKPDLLVDIGDFQLDLALATVLETQGAYLQFRGLKYDLHPLAVQYIQLACKTPTELRSLAYYPQSYISDICVNNAGLEASLGLANE